jgi:hypothetical protein
MSVAGELQDDGQLGVCCFMVVTLQRLPVRTATRDQHPLVQMLASAWSMCRCLLLLGVCADACFCLE